MSSPDETRSRAGDEENDSLLVEWAADVALRIRDGQTVDWEALAAQHPERAERSAGCCPPSP